MTALNSDQINLIKEYIHSLGVEYCEKGRAYTKLDGSNKIALFLKNKLPVTRLLKAIPELRTTNLLDLSEAEYIEVIGSVMATMAKEVKGYSGPLADDGLKNLISSLVPVYNSDNSDKIVLYSPVSHRITSYDFKHWLAITGNKLSDIRSTIPIAEWRFNPYVLTPTFNIESDGFDILCLNLYNPPKWRFKKVEAKIPTIIQEFLDHLFPNKEAQRYSLHWLHNMILKRNQTYLCLVGARGIGKGIFSEELAGALVGFKYSDKVGDSILIDKFNGPLKDKRLVILDEVDLDDNKKIARLKSFANDMIPMESKGKDSYTEHNYNSFIIATNSLDGMSFGPEERRFSIPEITYINLSHKWSSEKIEELITILKDEESEEVAEFGNYLIEYGAIPNKNEFYCFKGSYYFEVLRTSMKEWQKFIVDTITAKTATHYFIKDLSRDFRKYIKDNSDEHTANRSFFPRADSSTLYVFLKGYLHLGEDRLGVMDKVLDEEKGRKEWAIIPSEKFRPEHNFIEVTGHKSEADLGF